ncbi:glycosyltransferase family 2 protein [Candidatus Woesearchaeota archaeon]|nr:glycosyltransferase family 2 protein [Candidatus Woesearchaeota archaeon]
MKGKKRFELSIAVPAYNEKKNLPVLIRKYREAKRDVRFQLVIVDNGSSDGTAEFLAREIKKKDNRFIKVATVKKNIGYGYGINQGLKACDADIIGFSHADMQCDPKDVFRAYRLYRKLAKKHRNLKILVKGHRTGRYWKQMVLSRGLQAFSTLVLMRMLNDINGQPKIFPRRLFDTFKRPPLEFSYDIYVQYKAKKNGYVVYPFKVDFRQRLHGHSKWDIGKTLFSKWGVIKKLMKDVIEMKIGQRIK